jgi:hypothetical protein
MSTPVVQNVPSGPRKGLRILSLGKLTVTSHDEPILRHEIDAGGPQGISQLQILVEVMDRVSGESEKRPCEVFDVIGGAGTGG